MSSTTYQKQSEAENLSSHAKPKTQLKSQASSANSKSNEALNQLQVISHNSAQSNQLQKLNQLAKASERTTQLKALTTIMDNSTAQRVEDEEALQGKFASVQRIEEEDPLQGKFATVQRMVEEEPLQAHAATAQRIEDEEPLQAKLINDSIQRAIDSQPAKSNDTGLPDNLKSGIESLSGMNMDHVKVHYNSAQPAQLNAHAYAQGSDIHIAPGQEQHLPHEAWHVVQQAQGRVRPTMQMQSGIAVNDDVSLESEADVMGARAIHQMGDTVKTAQMKGLTNSRTIQFMLPGSYEESEADDYNPHGKSDTYRSGVDNFKRLASSGFITGWREKMIDHWNDKGWVTKPNNWGIRGIKEQKTGQFIDERGIQLDHAKTVSSMKDDLLDVDENQAISAAYSNSAMKNYYHLEDGKKKHIAWPKSKTLAKKKTAIKNTTVEPTIHGARKYYHDMDNLVPLAGTDNAAKGDKDVAVFDWDWDFLKNQREWEEMMGWVREGVSNKDIDEVTDAVDAMKETLDEYDGDWPVL
ncbi:eCIS core domain-containing protein [Undibacterium flavidum]|uniref:eCIS core domain-containing protein n=1 Tax=Undibacterium flavidum TaxID=2762297 RepID=UPI001E2C1D68|nr:DUF4157 domain-containing protein [Undibacterium flavidum]